MEKKDQLNGKICEVVTRISGVALNSFTCRCLKDQVTVTFCSLNSLTSQFAVYI